MPPRVFERRRPIPSRGRAFLLVSLLVGLGLPSLAGAQDLPSAGAGTPPRPLELLIEHRDSLGLTSDQLDRLGQIRERLANANEPLVNRMLTLRRRWQRERGIAQKEGGQQNQARLDRIRRAAEPIRERIQRNNRTAMQAVNRLLTREQRAQLRAIVEERRKVDGAEAPARGGSDAGGNDSRRPPEAAPGVRPLGRTGRHEHEADRRAM